MATKKKESATGFRNGKMFCFNCGGSFSYALPAPVKEFADQCKAFDKLHQYCKKTWIEPIPEPNGKTLEQNIEWFVENGEHGISSSTMLYHLTGRKIGEPGLGHPSDPDDFKRCHKLLQAIPQLKTQLQSMKRLGKTWANLVDNWDKLTTMYEDLVEKKKDNGMFDFMKTLGC